MAVAAALTTLTVSTPAVAQNAECTVLESDWGKSPKATATNTYNPVSAADFANRFANMATSGQEPALQIPAECRLAFIHAMTVQSGWEHHVNAEGLQITAAWDAVGEIIYFPKRMTLAVVPSQQQPAPQPVAHRTPAPAPAAPATTSNPEIVAAANQAQANAAAAEAAAARDLAQLHEEDAQLATLEQTPLVQTERSLIAQEIADIRTELETQRELINTLSRDKADRSWVTQNYATKSSVNAVAGRVSAVEGKLNPKSEHYVLSDVLRTGDAPTMEEFRDLQCMVDASADGCATPVNIGEQVEEPGWMDWIIANILLIVLSVVILLVLFAARKPIGRAWRNRKGRVLE